MAALVDMRVAISQPTMHWDLQGNLAEVALALRVAAEHGAELVAFPELTLTGLHTKVPELLDRARLERSLHEVARLCQDIGVAAAVGLPLWTGNADKPRDTVVILDADGNELMRGAKMRLMPPGEPIVFEVGTERPIVEHAGTTLAIVICREILDRAELADELGERARVILWPAMMARPPGDPVRAMDLAREQNAWVFHSNWAVNVEAPHIRNTGRSLVISPQGELLLEAPAHQAGLLLAWESSLARAWTPMTPADGARPPTPGPA